MGCVLQDRLQGLGLRVCQVLAACYDETSNSICYGDERSVSVFVQKEEYSYCGCCSLGLIGLDRENRS